MPSLLRLLHLYYYGAFGESVKRAAKDTLDRKLDAHFMTEFNILMVLGRRAGYGVSVIFQIFDLLPPSNSANTRAHLGRFIVGGGPQRDWGRNTAASSGKHPEWGKFIGSSSGGPSGNLA